jgi:hypothetical protein
MNSKEGVTGADVDRKEKVLKLHYHTGQIVTLHFSQDDMELLDAVMSRLLEAKCEHVKLGEIFIGLAEVLTNGITEEEEEQSE